MYYRCDFVSALQKRRMLGHIQADSGRIQSHPRCHHCDTLDIFVNLNLNAFRNLLVTDRLGWHGLRLCEGRGSTRRDAPQMRCPRSQTPVWECLSSKLCFGEQPKSSASETTDSIYNDR